MDVRNHYKEIKVAFQKIGIMSIGEMGFHWAKLLKSHGVEVLTYDKDRGEVSRKRGENAEVKSLPSMAALVREAEALPRARSTHSRRQTLHPERRKDVDHQRRLCRPVHGFRQSGW